MSLIRLSNFLALALFAGALHGQGVITVPPGGSGGGGTANPGGATNSVQTNAGGTLGGVAPNSTTVPKYLYQANGAAPVMRQIVSGDIAGLVPVAGGLKTLSGGTATVTVPSGVTVCTATDVSSVAAAQATLSGTTLTLEGNGADQLSFICLATAALNATSTALSFTPASPTQGQNVTFTAMVTPSSGPTGSVTFKDGTTALGTVSLTNGVATLVINTLSTGSHSVTAGYTGDSAYAASTSSASTVTVAAAPSSAPYTDNFTGTGTLAAPWTLTSNNSGVMPTKNNGTVTTTGAGNIFYNAGYNDPNKSTIKYGLNSYPIIQARASDGSLYVWAVRDNVVFTTTSGGGYNKGVVSGCPTVNTGDTITLSMNSSGVVTCTDVTTSTSATGTDSAPLTGGFPGVWMNDSSATFSAPAVMGNN